MSPESLIKSRELGVGAHASESVEGGSRAYKQGQLPLNDDPALPPLKGQLLKWIGNKQKFAGEIITYLPKTFGTYFEPFLGSGAVLAHLAPQRAVASDVFPPLMEIWKQLHADVAVVVDWYATRYALVEKIGKQAAYDKVRANYNAAPNGADLLFLSRVCYGGVVRFRKADGYMSTPCGPHQPMPVSNFRDRAYTWAARTRGVEFATSDFEESLARAKPGDVAYLDPPYFDSQTIIYGAQEFGLDRLYSVIQKCKVRGVRVALSLDGTKKSGDKKVDVRLPKGLFEREIYVHLGRSMLRRFQMNGQTLESEHVTDRLLLTY